MPETIIKMENSLKHLLMEEYIIMAEKGHKPDRKYVLQMYSDFGIKHSRSKDDSAGCYEDGTVILPVRCSKEYFVSTALHELGHAILATKFQFNYWKRATPDKFGYISPEWLDVFGLVSETDEEAEFIFQTYPIIKESDEYSPYPQYISNWNYVTQRTERYARLFEAYFMHNRKLRQLAPGLYNKIKELLKERFTGNEAEYQQKVKDELKRIKLLAMDPDSPYNSELVKV